MFSHTKLFDYYLYGDFQVWKYVYMNICSYNHFWILKRGVFKEKGISPHLKKTLVIPALLCSKRIGYTWNAAFLLRHFDQA